MNRSMIVALAAAVLAACSHGQKTDETAAVSPPPNAAATAPAGPTETRVGIVSEMGPGTMNVRPVPPAGSGQDAISYSPQTALTRAGAPANWSEVAKGTPVRVTYSMQNGVAAAQSVDILTGPEAQTVMEQGKAAYGNAVMPGMQHGNAPPPPMK